MEPLLGPEQGAFEAIIAGMKTAVDASYACSFSQSCCSRTTPTPAAKPWSTHPAVTRGQTRVVTLQGGVAVK